MNYLYHNILHILGNFVSKDINGTRERVKNALQHEDEPVPHKRRRRTENGGMY